MREEKVEAAYRHRGRDNLQRVRILSDRLQERELQKSGKKREKRRGEENCRRKQKDKGRGRCREQKEIGVIQPPKAQRKI